MWLSVLFYTIYSWLDYLWGSFVRFSYLSAGISFFPQLVIRPTTTRCIRRRKLEIILFTFLCPFFIMCVLSKTMEGKKKRKDKLKMEKIEGTYHNIVYSSPRISKALMKWVDRYNDPHIFISFLFVTQATNYLSAPGGCFLRSFCVL